MDPVFSNYIQQAQENSQQQSLSNPFDAGIRKAIESARESMGMTEKQQNKAFRRSLLEFGNNIAQQPVRKGFWNNFGDVSRALMPAIVAHDDYEEKALKENNALANQMLAYDIAKQNRQQQLEEKAWQRDITERKLAEQQRYHDLMAERYDRSQGEFNDSGNIEQDNTPLGKFDPIQSKQELNLYIKDKKALGAVLHEINELEKSYNKFRHDYKDNIIDPMGPYSGAVNPVKGLLGRFGNKAARTENSDLETLNSKLNKFVISSERALKGGGVMGPALIKYFEKQNIYPNLKTDNPEKFESKLKSFKEEIENNYKAANASLKYGVRLDPSQVHDFENMMEPKNIKEKSDNPTPIDHLEEIDQKVMLRNREGITIEIPATDEGALRDAIEDGFEMVAND
jgi:hypothetical protein